jgi:biopolymer transport protein ExbD
MTNKAAALILAWASLLLVGCGRKEEPDTAEQETSRQTRTDAIVTIVQKEKGAPVRYQLGERETGDLAQLTRWLAEAKRGADAAGSQVVGRICASHFTPNDEIVEVLKRFEKAGIENVEFFGGDPAVTKRLKWPSSNAD